MPPALSAWIVASMPADSRALLARSAATWEAKRSTTASLLRSMWKIIRLYRIADHRIGVKKRECSFIATFLLLGSRKSGGNQAVPANGDPRNRRTPNGL